MAGRRIVVEFLGKDTSLGKTADQTESKVGKMGDRFRRVGDAAGKIFVGGLVAGGAAMVKFGNQASDLAETQSKVIQIFGKDGARNLGNFADSAAKTMGQSKQMALDAASTFGMFGKAAGQSGTDLVNFSTRMTVLSSDMASFNNTSPEQAIEAIGAALRGESEPIRAYGVMLNDASLKAEALSMGLLKPVKDSAKIASANATLLNAQKAYNEAVKEHGKDSLQAVTAQARLGAAQSSLKKATDGTIGPLTQQQKILASQSLIIKQTKDQQGDFARTSNGLANKQRILKAEFQNLTTQLGQKALPIMKKVTDWGLKSIAWVDKHQKLVKILAGVFGGLVGSLWLIVKVTQAYTAVQAALNVVMTMNPIGLVVIAIAALVAGLIIAYKKSETFRNIVNGAFTAIKTVAGGVLNWLTAAVKNTIEFVRSHWKLILGILTGPIGAATIFIVSHFGSIKNAASNVVSWVKGIPGKLGGLAKDFGNAGKNLIGKFVDGMKNAGGVISGIAGNVWNAVKKLLNKAIDKINTALEFKISLPGPDITVNPPNIPKLAKGGIVRARPGGTLAVLGEAGRDEAVIPLGGGSRRISSSGGGGISIVINGALDPVAVGRQIDQILTKYARTTGRPLSFA